MVSGHAIGDYRESSRVLPIQSDNSHDQAAKTKNAKLSSRFLHDCFLDETRGEVGLDDEIIHVEIQHRPQTSERTTTQGMFADNSRSSFHICQRINQNLVPL